MKKVLITAVFIAIAWAILVYAGLSIYFGSINDDNWSSTGRLIMMVFGCMWGPIFARIYISGCKPD